MYKRKEDPQTGIIYEQSSQMEVRQFGKTTRLADLYIQLFFMTGEITVRDHIDNAHSHKHLLDKITKRLDLEHRHIYYKVNGLTIKKVNKPMSCSCSCSCPYCVLTALK